MTFDIYIWIKMRLRSIRHRQSDPYPPPPRSVEHRGIHQTVAGELV